MTGAAPPARLRGIDALRAVAVLLVLGRHAELGTGVAKEHLGPLAAAWNRGGWVGVDLFFVLSGFLVSGLIYREHARTGRFAPWSFLARRGLKIYPAFYVMLVVGLVFNAARGRPSTAGQVLAEATFMQSYFPGAFNHTWSLSVEEHFYLLLTALLWWSARGAPPLPDPALAARPARPFALVVPLAAVLLVVCLAARAWLASRGPLREADLLFPTHLRIDGLMLGAALGHLTHHDPGRSLDGLAMRCPRLLVLIGALLLAPAFLVDLEASALIPSLGLTSFALGSGLVLLGTLRSPAPGPIVGRGLDLLAAVGAHSYSIYLWHMIVGPGAQRALAKVWPGQPFGVAVITYVGGSIAAGVVLAKLIELPVLRLRDRWLPSRSGALTT